MTDGEAAAREPVATARHAREAGAPKVAVACVRLALSLEPALLEWADIAPERSEAAVVAARRCVRLDPASSPARVLLEHALSRAGWAEDASHIW